MILNGKYNNAEVFTDNVGNSTISQIINLCNQENFKDSSIKIMPDCHAGKGCTIGTTMTIKDSVVPNLVGVDIGCGMTAYELQGELNLEKLDRVIRENVPHGFSVNNKEHMKAIKYFGIDLNKINAELINKDRLYKSCGSLGSGNHFIEVSRVNNKNIITIHTGSRNLGKQVAEYHQQKAIESVREEEKHKRDVCIASLKECGKEQLISEELKKLIKKVPDELCFLTGPLMVQYLSDMDITQNFAKLNRLLIIGKIINGYYYDNKKSSDDIAIEIKNDVIESIHNYIDINSMILRKGAISAKAGEKVIIPLNMADGIIFGIGKGNENWNWSAPHGAGRIFSRGQAKREITMEEFKESMKDVFTTCVVESTLDEAPQAYKPADEIIKAISETVEIECLAKPIYNFKSN